MNSYTECSAGLRGYLEVENKLNVPASFQWHARDGVDTSVFFMVHPTGTYVHLTYVSSHITNPILKCTT